MSRRTLRRRVDRLARRVANLRTPPPAPQPVPVDWPALFQRIRALPPEERERLVYALPLSTVEAMLQIAEEGRDR